MLRILVLLLTAASLLTGAAASEPLIPGVIPDSEKITVEPGFSGLITIKIPKISDSTKEMDDYYDAFFYRHKQFVFGRRGHQLYFNFNDGEGWSAYINSNADFSLEENRTYQLAFTCSIHRVTSQGELWTDIVLYANGKEVGRKRIEDRIPFTRNEPVQFAQGKGFGAGWLCHAELFDRKFFNRTLDAEEIAAFAAAEKRIKFIPDRAPEPPAERLAQIRAFQAKIQTLPPERRTVMNAISSAIIQLARQPESAPYTNALQAAQSLKESRPAQCGPLNLYYGNRSLLILNQQDGRVLEWYDLINDRRLLLTEATPWWQAELRDPKGKKETVSALPQQEMPWHLLQPVRKEGDGIVWSVSWDDPKCQAEADFVFAGDRLSFQLRLAAGKPYFIHETAFPYYKLATYPGDGSLLAPTMSGAVTQNAMSKNYTFSGNYPTGFTSMQLGAWYDKKGGVYFAAEDGFARAKSILFRATRREIQLQWRWPVARPRTPEETSFFAPGCSGVLTAIPGSWYDAGLCYREFLEREAIWYRTAQPVTEFPEWFRNNTLWLTFTCQATSVELMRKLKDYLELPFALHFYNLYGTFDRDYPHHSPDPLHYLWIQQLRQMGLYVVPYTNGRIWDMQDHRDLDYSWSTKGKADAVKLPNGSVQSETYHKTTFGVMCASCTGWQQEIAGFTKRILELDNDGIYFDQIGAARPRLCFATDHPHAPNDPDAWYRGGYRPLLERLRAEYPWAVMTTEDNAEPYVGLMHGMLSWRWLMDGNVPLYVLCYGGKTEMVGRSFGGSGPEVPVMKFYQQWMQGEQMGWIGKEMLTQANNAFLRLQVKRLMHLRAGLLDYFQQGILWRPAEITPLDWKRIKWGSMGDKIIATPDTAITSWKWKERRLYLLVSQRGDARTITVDCGPMQPGESWRYFTVSGKNQCSGKAGDPISLSISPDDPGAILIGSGADFRQESDRLEKLFAKVRVFNSNNDPFIKRNKK